MKGPLPKINDNTLAQHIAQREGKLKQEDIGQIKEQLRVTKELLKNYNPFRIISWIYGKKKK